MSKMPGSPTYQLVRLARTIPRATFRIPCRPGHRHKWWHLKNSINTISNWAIECCQPFAYLDYVQQ